MTPQPNLVIIGAQKSGTTSLYHYLKGHPEIFMSSPIKEPGYFMKQDFIDRLFRRLERPVQSRQELLRKYMLNGYEGERYFGEASTYYTIGRNSSLHDAPARMRQTNPAMKLIYIVRNPFARIVSNYLHSVRAGHFKGDFSGYIGTRHYQRALLTSCYWFQLRTYLEYFPEQQIKVVRFEDLVTDCRRVLEEIYAFLELEPEGETVSKIHNPSDNRSEFESRDLLFPATAFREAAGWIRPDVEQLAEFMQHSPDWALNAEHWCIGENTASPAHAG